jgi:hypothetical protein
VVAVGQETKEKQKKRRLASTRQSYTMARPQRTYAIDPNKRKLFASPEEEQEYIEESSTSHEDECDKEEYKVDEDDANEDDDDSESSDDVQDDDGDDDFVAPANHGRTRNSRRTGQGTRNALAAGTKSSSRRPTRARRGNDDDEEDSDKSEDEDIAIAKLKPQTRQNGANHHASAATWNRSALAGDDATAEQNPKRARVAVKDVEEDASFLDKDDDSDQEEMPNPSPKKRGQPKKTVAVFHDDDDDDEVSFHGDDDNNGDEAVELTKPSPMKRGRPKKKVAALPDDDDEEEEFYEEEDEDDDFEEIINSTQRKIGRPRKIQASLQKGKDKHGDKSKPRKLIRARKPKREDDDDVDEDEESYHDEESDDEDDDHEQEEGALNVSPRKRGRPKKIAVKPQNKARNKRERPRKNSLPSYDDSDEEEKKISKPMAQRSNRQRRPGRPKRRIVDKEEDDSDEEKEDDLDQWSPGQTRGKGIHSSSRSRRSARLTYNGGEREMKGKKKYKDDDDGNNDDNDQGNAPLKARRTTPERFSVAYAKQNICYAENSDDDEVDDENDKIPYSLPTTKSRLRVSSDEEFLADDEEVMGIIETDSDDVEGDDDDDDSLIEDVKAMTADQDDDSDDEKQVAPKNIDDEELGSEEDSGSDEENEARKHQTNSVPNPSTPENALAKSSRRLSEITPRSKTQHSSDDSSSEYSGGTDDDKVASGVACSHHCVHRQSTRSRHQRAGLSSAPKLPQCPSTDDAITLEALPQRHVCYFSPDGNSRQCFALETLRHIALSNARQQFRTDLTGEQQQSFLQPPHFRTPMSAFLLDQIASRFGREALDLHGDYYRRKKEPDQLPPPRTDSDDHDDDDYPYDYATRFSHDFQLYIDRQMGSQDVYACPLCYSEMHARLDSNGEENQGDSNSEGEEDDRDSSTAQKCLVESKYDPMLVLGYLDNDKFEAASAFCFTKVANLKSHLREDHNIQTNDIQGNDLYMRYKVRAPDGLLQRFIKKGSGVGMTYQGAMRIYWNQGNNYSFVCLLSMMEKAAWYRNLLETSEDEQDIDEASAHFEVAKEFIDSFRRRASLAWQRLSSPFRKSSGQDLKDFLINDDALEEVGEDDIATRRHVEQLLDARAASSEDENDLIHKIQRKYAENHDDKSDSDGDDDDRDYSAEGDESEIDESSAGKNPERVEMPNGYYSEVSEEDDWVKGIQSKKKGRLSTSENLNTKMPASKVSPDETPSAKKKVLRKLKASSAEKSTKRRALTLDDSDDDS